MTCGWPTHPEPSGLFAVGKWALGRKSTPSIAKICSVPPLLWFVPASYARPPSMHIPVILPAAKPMIQVTARFQYFQRGNCTGTSFLLRSSLRRAGRISRGLCWSCVCATSRGPSVHGSKPSNQPGTLCERPFGNFPSLNDGRFLGTDGERSSRFCNNYPSFL